jgi:hypothetical protein
MPTRTLPTLVNTDVAKATAAKIGQTQDHHGAYDGVAIAVRPFSQFASSVGNAEMFPDLDGLESDIQRCGSRRRAFRQALSDASRPPMSDPS